MLEAQAPPEGPHPSTAGASAVPRDQQTSDRPREREPWEPLSRCTDIEAHQEKARKGRPGLSAAPECPSTLGGHGCLGGAEKNEDFHRRTRR